MLHAEEKQMSQARPAEQTPLSPIVHNSNPIPYNVLIPGRIIGRPVKEHSTYGLEHWGIISISPNPTAPDFLDRTYVLDYWGPTMPQSKVQKTSLRQFLKKSQYDALRVVTEIDNTLTPEGRAKMLANGERFCREQNYPLQYHAITANCQNFVVNCIVDVPFHGLVGQAKTFCLEIIKLFAPLQQIEPATISYVEKDFALIPAVK